MSQAQEPRSTANASTDFEMGNLTTPAVDTAHNAPATPSALNAPPEPLMSPQSGPSQAEPIAMPQPALLRQDTVEAIGPSTDEPTPRISMDAASHAGPVIIINLLLTSTGTRHPYKIDEKYLSKRGVHAEGTDGAFDPFVISVYTLKELIWRDWREGMAHMAQGTIAQASFTC